jgi:MtN3 and saliva related transmembrane protein
MAACITTLAFLPQIVKVLKTRSAKDVSLFMLLQLSLGVFLWVLYGIHLKNVIIIAANSVTLASLIVLLVLYYRYK